MLFQVIERMKLKSLVKHWSIKRYIKLLKKIKEKKEKENWERINACANSVAKQGEKQY